jgi:hypothetical protein
MSENMIKRYILFQGERYYPHGGMEDYDGTYDTLEEAIANFGAYPLRWAHIIDRETLLFVWCDEPSMVPTLNKQKESCDARRAANKVNAD